MQVSAKVDYALRALIEIVRDPGHEPVPAEQVGRLQQIPTGFLQAIFADLRRAGIVRSVRGKGGGWLVAVPAESVSVADVIRAVDGPLVSVHGQSPENIDYEESVSALLPVWIAARSSLRQILESVSLDDLATGELPDDVMTHTADSDAWQRR